MSLFFVAGSLIASAFLIHPVAAAPWTNATCTSELWSFNSLQQSPCLVSAYLGAPCATVDDWAIYAVGQTGPYVLPPDAANVCLCNSIQWNLLSACSMCQGGPAGSWAAWTTYCSTSNTNIGSYPLPIPEGISVPHWAYYDFTKTGVFNAAIASQQSGPESTAAATAVATSRATTATSALPRPTASTTSQPANNTGAIIGGAVGGILGLGLIGLIAFVLVRKRNHKPADASHHPSTGQAGYNPPTVAQPASATPMMSQYQHPPQRPEMVPVKPSGSEYTYKPYDPSDPSTFPTGLDVSTPSLPYADSLPYYADPQHRPPQGNNYGTPQV